MNEFSKWVAPGVKNEALKKLEGAIRKMSLSLPWFKSRGETELTADNFGVTVKFILGGHFRLVHISLEEMFEAVTLHHGYEDRLLMQLKHLYFITNNSMAYSANDQITTKFEL